MSRTPSDLLPPAAAIALWAELRPDPPPTAHAFHTRAERLGVEPYTVNRVRLYSTAELENATLGERALLGVQLLRVVALAGALGYDVTLSASAGDDPPHVGIVTEDEAPYYGNLAGARRWLEEAAERAGGGA